MCVRVCVMQLNWESIGGNISCVPSCTKDDFFNKQQVDIWTTENNCMCVCTFVYYMPNWITVQIYSTSMPIHMY